MSPAICADQAAFCQSCADSSMAWFAVPAMPSSKETATDQSLRSHAASASAATALGWSGESASTRMYCTTALSMSCNWSR